STADPDDELLADGSLPGSLDLDDHAPRTAHGELRGAFVHAVSQIPAPRLLDAHPGHVHRLGDAHRCPGDRWPTGLPDMDANRRLPLRRRFRTGGDRYQQIADPLLGWGLRGLRLRAGRCGLRCSTLATHLHRLGALHLPVAHADGAHHAHHALRGLELALRIDQEVAARDDAVPFDEPVGDLHALVEAIADLDVARHEPAP